MNDEHDKPSIKVEDHRRFAADGSARDPEPAASKRSQPEGGRGSSADNITFSGFVVGLASQALSFLGVGQPANPAPSAEDQAQRLAGLGEASALIDILVLLQTKTAGNLSQDEQRLLEEILYDLRLRYVERKKGSSSSSGETS